MATSPQRNVRILAIAPSSRGFGFVIFEGQETFVDWGVKSAKGDKNAESLAKVKELMTHYSPEVLVLQDVFAKSSRRLARIRTLHQQIIALAKTRKITVAQFSSEHVRSVLLEDGKGTKQAIAEILAKRFPDELGSHLPPKRRPWMSEDSRMDIFEAVALVLVFQRKKAK